MGVCGGVLASDAYTRETGHSHKDAELAVTVASGLNGSRRSRRLGRGSRGTSLRVPEHERTAEFEEIVSELTK